MTNVSNISQSKRDKEYNSKFFLYTETRDIQ